MTPRERVKALLDAPWHPEPYGKRSFLSHDELEARIETAIIRAIEEEREACAQICDEAVRSSRKNSPYLRVNSPYLRVQRCADAIRARSSDD